jgi:cytochrome c biogenesis protein CcmG/thiol:disulfide interchange protein DsbE
MPRLVVVIVVALSVTACAEPAPSSVDELPLITPAEIASALEESERPVVVNIWASWCTPCRSEAPLLRTAAAEYGDRVDFVGVAVRDSQDGARAFIGEFSLTGLDHYFDPTGAIPASLGGRGVPITFFFAPGGDLVRTHNGVIDERTLVLLIDEVLG